MEDAAGLNVTEFRKYTERVRHRIDAEGFLQEQVTLTEGRRLNVRKAAAATLTTRCSYAAGITGTSMKVGGKWSPARTGDCW